MTTFSETFSMAYSREPYAIALTYQKSSSLRRLGYLISVTRIPVSSLEIPLPVSKKTVTL